MQHVAEYGQALLRLENLSKEFGGVRALSDVTLDIDEKCIYGVIGPNGAGKTTLFNVITGIYPLTSGRIHFEGRDITHFQPAAIARVGIARTFQSIHIFAGMSVLENVLMGQSRHTPTGLLSLVPFVADRRDRVLREEALGILSLLDLETFAHEPARDLPYALQRKVEIARAVASRPRLILLDEPAAGLNEDESGRLTGDLVRLRDQGMTIVLIEHDMSVVMSACERLAVLNFGEKIAEGSPEAIQRDSRVVEAYLGRNDDDEPVAPYREPVG